MWEPGIGQGGGGAQVLEPNYLASNLGSKLTGWVTLGRATVWISSVVLWRVLKLAPAYSKHSIIEALISKLLSSTKTPTLCLEHAH